MKSPGLRYALWALYLWVMEKTQIDESPDPHAKFLFAALYRGPSSDHAYHEVCLVPGNIRGFGSTYADAMGAARFRVAEWCRILGVTRSEWYRRVRKELTPVWQHRVTNRGEWL